MLAEMGYTAFAVDMYGDGKVAEHPEDALALMNEVRENLPVGEERLRAARAVLEEHPSTDGSRTAAIGYCFGGGILLHMARIGEDLAGVVSFHGGLATETPATAGTIQTRLLVLNGADDPWSPPEVRDSFAAEMKAAGADYRMVNYEGAVHSFTSPNATALGEQFDMPLRYDERADTESWAEMERFLAEVFSG